MTSILCVCVCVHVNTSDSDAEITCKLNFLGFIYTCGKSVAPVLPTLDVILHNVKIVLACQLVLGCLPFLLPLMISLHVQIMLLDHQQYDNNIA